MNFASIENLFAYLDKGNYIEAERVTPDELLIFHTLCTELLSATILAVTAYQTALSEELQTDETNRRMTNCTRVLNMLNMLQVVVSSDTNILQLKLTNTTINWRAVLGLTALHATPIFKSNAYRLGDREALAQLMIDGNTYESQFPLAEAWQVVSREANEQDLDKVWQHLLDVITCACKLVPL